MLNIDFDSLLLIYASLTGLFVGILASKLLAKTVKMIYTNPN